MKRHRQSYDLEERRRIATLMSGWKLVVDSLQSRQEMKVSFSPSFDEDIGDLETPNDTLEMLRTPDLTLGFGMG